jgi:penicillin-insensitive murein endopeptidase
VSIRHGFSLVLTFLVLTGMTSRLVRAAINSPIGFNDDEAEESDDATISLADLPGIFDSLLNGPGAGSEQARGFYAKGSLTNSSSFPLEGDGFIKILRPRQRWYATSDYVEMVEKATAEIHARFPEGERLQLGDIAAKDGGYISGHASHQNGLDGDLVYFRKNHFEQDPNDASGMHELFVINGKISPNFDTDRVWLFINHIYDTGRLVRIFMDPVIKDALCEYAKHIGDFNSKGVQVLRHLRPLTNHQNHMHVRISCPANSPDCIAQVEVPPGSGCPGSSE